jgi:hypothetical protein
MMRSRDWWTRSLFLTLLAGCASPLAAQKPDEPPRSLEVRQRSAQLVQAFVDQATIELGLTSEQRSGLEDVLDETLERRYDLGRRQLELQRRIREALADPQRDDAEIRRLADSVLVLKRQEVELLSWQQRRLDAILSPRQALRFLLMQERLAQRIEELRRRPAERPPPE